MILVGKRLLLITACAALLLSMAACKQTPYYKTSGFIQGTTYHVTYQWNSDLGKEIDSVLERFNQSLNNYDSTSFISRLNANITDSLTDSLFIAMFNEAKRIHSLSDGAFDITVAPLANAWGFGFEQGQLPDSAQVDSLMQFTGMDKLQIKNNRLIKAHPNVQLIGNAIAQGMSVDYIAKYLGHLGIENYLVEIGGEVYANGHNNRGETWKVGIDKPLFDSLAINRENQLIISLDGMAVATSGNYRKYREENTGKIGHTIHPLSGYPVKTPVLSATVIAPSAMTADAWATAFMVMGVESALEICRATDSLDAYLICDAGDANAEYRIFKSKSVANYIKNQD